jgi:hypothetical protein
MRILRGFLSQLPLFAAGVLSVSAWAQPGIPFQGSFTAGAEASPNTAGASFCGGSKTDEVVIEAHGSGFTTLGAFTFTLQKTLNLSTGALRGCLVLTNPNGDTLKANYNLTQQSSTTDFNPASGTLTFTGGTGLFKNATGSAKVSATFLGLYPANSFIGGGSGPLQVMATYVVNGVVSFLGQF